MITDPSWIWAMPGEKKNLAHPLQVTGRVSYYDPGFKLFWIERDDVGVYVQLASNPPPLRTGQTVAIEGRIIPNKGLSADDVTVRVLEEHSPITPLDAKGRINDLVALSGRIVTAEAYVDSQQLIDAEHVRLSLISENRPVICWIKPDDPAHVPDWRGRFVRVTGLYSSRFDPTQTNSSIEFWLGRQDGLQVLGSLENLAGAQQAATPINVLYRMPPGTEVLVRGRIETHRVGRAMTIRDGTGQVEIRSIQQQRLPIGTLVEARGRVTLSTGQWVIDAALYRPLASGPARVKNGPTALEETLKAAAQVRDLGSGEAAQGRPAELSGMVTWASPDADFFFLQDVTGSVRVYYDRAKTGAIAFLKYFRVAGVTRAGALAPGIELQSFTDLGSMSHPPARAISFEQAMTGKADGEWVEMRGFIRSTDSKGDWRWIHVTTPAGEFVGHLQNSVGFTANPGSLVRVHGVCDTAVDASGHVTGITLQVPFLHDINIEEDAPADYFDLPRSPLKDLVQLSTNQTMQRVRVAGTVQYSIPGRLIYLREEKQGLLLLTHEAQVLLPGDQIEAVGILGREGARTVLRESVFRKTGTEPKPEPFSITEAKQLEPAADSRLVRMQGTLIDRVDFDHLGQTRLTLQQGTTLYEATLEQSTGLPPLQTILGSELAVTGIYQLKFDDARKARGFQLQLRTIEDVVVAKMPRLWNLPRALGVAGFLSGCVLLGLAWIYALRRRVRHQTAQIRNQMEEQVRLAAELQRAARLESLGVLAGGIAHDYNNLLTVIMGNLALMKFTPSVMSAEGSRVEEIEAAAIRARDLTRQLLTFAEGGDPLRAAADLAAVVREAMEAVLHETPVQCTYQVARDLAPAFIDRDQIRQAVQNLTQNALQAMAAGGTLQVQLANEDIPAGHPGGLAAGPYVRLTFVDSGEGIAPEVLPRIFDPYFSTRETSGGLGLATVYSIVKKHQGHIEAHSQPGQGSQFVLWLPVAAAPEAGHQIDLPLAPALSPANSSQPPVTSRRVLLMDDEESIRKLGVILLERMKLEVTAVRDGASAVHEFEAARDTGRPFALLILDLTIVGGMGGIEAIEIIRKSGATVPAIVSSGYSRDPVMANYRAYGFQAVIPKPYDIRLFKEKVLGFLPEPPAQN